MPGSSGGMSAASRRSTASTGAPPFARAR
jgi:hypothetical protein